MYLEHSPAIILPRKRPLLKRILRGDEYLHARERELNYHIGQRGFLIQIYNWQGQVIKRFHFTEESDAIELFIEIHTPGFDPRIYDIPGEIAHIELALTQAITSTSTSTQQFAIPNTWWTQNTISVIGTGGASGQGGINNSVIQGGCGGGGAAFASISNLIGSADRNGTFNFFISSTSSSSAWFFNTGTVLADGGNNAVSGSFTGGGGFGSPGSGGTVANSVGTTRRAGGTGARGASGSIPSSGVYSIQVGGGGAGSAAGTSAGGQTPTAPTSSSGGDGADSDTASGGSGGTGIGPPGGTGSDFDASHGAGAGGAGGGAPFSFPQVGGTGGLYGGGAGGPGAWIKNEGSGGDAETGAITAGRQGMIWLTWSPYQFTEFYQSN